MEYHYTESGLDYVYLANGFSAEETPWGEAVSVEAPEKLHHLIGMIVCDTSEPLTGQELKFARIELDMTQKALGMVFGHADGQTVARMEKARHDSIPQYAEIIVRALLRESLNGENTNVTALVKRLADLEREAFHRRRVAFEMGENHWSLSDEQL